MAKSSIHIESGKIGFFSHNDRSRSTKNSIFSDEKNFTNRSAREAIKIFKSELEKRTRAYLKNHPTRKKLHARTQTHLSAIINLNYEHTERDVKKVCDFLEAKFDTKILQFSLHKDEGYVSDTGENIKNYHAHIEFMGLQSDGSSIKRKLHRKELINLQTNVAEILNMQRGKNYSAEKIPRPKRLDTYEFKSAKKSEYAILAEKKDLQKNIKKMREELKKKNAQRSDYAELEALNRTLLEKIKNKDLSLQDLREKFENLRKIANFRIQEANENLKNLQNKLIKARQAILNKNETIDTQKQKIELLYAKISELEHKSDAPDAKRVKGKILNTENLKNFSELIKKADPDFQNLQKSIEIETLTQSDQNFEKSIGFSDLGQADFEDNISPGF
jgi:hypothetical protein